MINLTIRVFVTTICVALSCMILACLSHAQSTTPSINSVRKTSSHKTKLHKCIKPKVQKRSKPMIKKETVNTTVESPKTAAELNDCQTKPEESNNTGSAARKEQEQTTDKEKPCISEAKGGGAFNGDLRDLPNTKPVQQENPNREPPKITPKVLPPKKVTKP